MTGARRSRTGWRPWAVVLAFGGLLAFTAPGLGAQQETPRWGIGFQSSFPAYGLSGVYDLNEEVTLQAVLGAFGTFTTLSARGLYRFQREGTHDLYGFGSAGLWRWSALGFSESSLGVGGGAGVELDWRRILVDEAAFPPIFTSIDVGLTFASFSDEAPGFSVLTLGVGLHYRF